MAIPVYERRENISPLPGARVQAPGGAEAYGAGIGAAISRAAEAGIKMAEDFEDTETLEAFNNFKRDVSLYHNAPEKGVFNSRLGKDAKGLYEQADLWMQNKAEEYVRKMKSPRMTNNFRRMAGQTILSQGEQNSRFESDQFRRYQNAEADAAIDMAVNDAVENWDDDTAVNTARATAIQALALRDRGMGEKVWEADLGKLDSRIAMGRLGRMIEADPLRAEQWYGEHKESFLGADRGKAEELLERETKAYKLESIRDDLIKRHGMNYAAARREILDNYQGEEEQRALALYEGWYSDQKRIQEEAQRGREDNFFRTLQGFDSKEKAMAYALKNSKSLSGFARAESFVTWIFDERKETKPGALDKVLGEIDEGKYNGMTLQQIKAEVGPLFSRDDYKEYIEPAFREKKSENKTNSQIAESVIRDDLKKIKDRLGNDNALIERFERRYRQETKAHPEMSAEERLSFAQKLVAKQKLGTIFYAGEKGNFYKGGNYYLRERPEMRGLDILEMEEQGYRFDNATQKWVRKIKPSL